MPSSSNPESKARIHTHTCTQAQKQTKTKKRRSTRLAPLPQFCAEGRAGYFGSKRLQLKVAANKKETTKIKREKNRTSLNLLRGDPPPRMAKGHVVRHAVPPCAREPILEVHHRHLLFRRKYKKKQKERGANKKTN